MGSIVFLDRDGTINLDSGYVTSPERVKLIPNTADALAKIRQAGFSLVIVTNQSAIGRGMATVADVNATNQEVQRQLLAENPAAIIDQVLFSSSAPGQGDNRRKPGIGLLNELREDINLDPKYSWVVGDKLCDIEFGINASLPVSNCILVLTGEGKNHINKLPTGARVADDLLDAAQLILGKE